METEIFCKNLGKKIKSLRKAYGHTQETLGDYLNITKSAIVNYETGIRKIPLDLLVKIAQLYNIRLDTLIGKEKTLDNVLKSALANNTLTEDQEELLVNFINILIGVNKSEQSFNTKQKQG